MAKKKKEVEADSRNEQLAALFKVVDKKFGKGSIRYAKDINIGDIKRIGTGIITLDRALGGGLPIGRISNFYGPKSSGKTTNLLRAAGRAQRMCSNCWTPAFQIWTPDYTDRKPECECGNYRRTMIGWIDVEGVWDEVWSK